MDINSLIVMLMKGVEGTPAFHPREIAVRQLKLAYTNNFTLGKSPFLEMH